MISPAIGSLAQPPAPPPGRGRIARDRIVDVAAEIVDTDGLEALNIPVLCEALRIKGRSLRKHFADIEMIKVALALRALGELIELTKEASRGRVGRNALMAAGHAQRTYAQARPGRYLATVRRRRGQTAAVSTLRQSLLRLFATMLESYGMDGDAAMDFARCSFAALQGFLIVELCGGVGSPFETDQSYQRLLDMLDNAARAAVRSGARRKPGKSAGDPTRASETIAAAPAPA